MERRVDIYLDLSDDWRNIQLDSSRLWAEKAYSLADSITYPRGITRSINFIGLSQYLQSNYFESIQTFRIGVERAIGLSDSVFLSHFYGNMGLAFDKIGLFEESIANHKKSYEVKMLIGEIGSAYESLYNMAVVYTYGAKNFELAVKYLRMAEVYFRSDSKYAYNNVHVYNLFAYSYLHFAKNLDSVEYYINRARRMMYPSDSYAASYVYTNLSGYFAERGNWDSAIYYIERVIEINTELNSTLGVAQAYENAAQYCVMFKKPKEARSYLDKAIEALSQESAFDAMSRIHSIEAEYYALIGDYENAFLLLQKGVEANNNAFNTETSLKLGWLRSLTEEDRLEQQNSMLTIQKDLQQARAEKEANRRRLLLVSTFSLLLFGIVMYYRFRMKNRLNHALDIANKSLTESEKLLQELNRAKDSFFAIIGHDLRNPIMAYRNIVESLSRERYAAHDRENALLQELTQSADSLLHLLQNLLTWARSEQGKLNYRPRAVLLKDEVVESVKIYKGVAKEKGVELRIIMDDDLLIMADREMIQTIIRNLVNNALKFTDHGSVTVSAASTQEETRIFIADTGIGMAEKEIELLTSMNGELDFALSVGAGTGIGLWLVRMFLNKHNSVMEIKSQPGEGTEISFTIKNFM